MAFGEALFVVAGPHHLALRLEHNTTGLERGTDPQRSQITGDALVALGRIPTQIVVDLQDVAGLFTAEFTRTQQALHIEMAGGVLGRQTTSPALGVPAAATGITTAVVNIHIAIVGVSTDLERLAQRYIHTKTGAVGIQS